MTAQEAKHISDAALPKIGTFVETIRDDAKSGHYQSIFTAWNDDIILQLTRMGFKVIIREHWTGKQVMNVTW